MSDRDNRLDQILALVQSMNARLEALEQRALDTRPMKERLDQIYAEVSATRAELADFRQDFRLLDRRQGRDHDKQIDLEERLERLEERVIRLEGGHSSQ